VTVVIVEDQDVAIKVGLSFEHVPCVTVTKYGCK